MSMIGDIIGSVAKAVLPAVIDAELHRTDVPVHQADTPRSTAGTFGSLANFIPPGGLHPVADTHHVDARQPEGVKWDLANGRTKPAANGSIVDAANFPTIEPTKIEFPDLTVLDHQQG